MHKKANSYKGNHHCDQTGQFLKVFGNKLFWPNYLTTFWGIFKNIDFYVQTEIPHCSFTKIGLLFIHHMGSNLRSFGQAEILLRVELLLQLQELLARESRSTSTRL